MGDDDEKDERERMMDLKMQQNLGGEKYGYFPVPSSDRVNISEEMAKSGIWLQVRRDSVPIGLGGLENQLTGNSSPTK